MRWLAVLLLAGCATAPEPLPPNAASSFSCLTWACREDRTDCELLTCERALPLMERQLCIMRGVCVET